MEKTEWIAKEMVAPLNFSTYKHSVNLRTNYQQCE
jgi:hypothetical protein